MLGAPLGRARSRGLQSQLGCVQLVSAALVSLLVAGCAKGTSERAKPSPRDSLVPTLRRDPLPEVDASVPESQTSRLARLHMPTDEPLDDVPKALRCSGEPVSRVMRRLNRREYNNTVRDLLGDNSRPSDAFPEDGFGDSFDNNAAALSVSPLLMEGYQAAAHALGEAAVAKESPVYEELLGCSLAQKGTLGCARETLSAFTARAFRRPLLDAELEPFIELLLSARDEGLTYPRALQVTLEAVFLSPNFLFQIERDVDPETSAAHRLTAFEVASRLSYGLWATMPDDALFKAAASGELDTPEGVSAQAERMLDDPKAEELLHSFVGQWLEVNDISRTNAPATELFPDYSPEVQAAMENETRLFMRDIVQGEVPFEEMLTADFTYVNQTLAKFYQLEGEFGDEFERTSLEGSERRGLLSHGSILTATGAPTRTSPVRRGVFVLSNLLCSPPPPPPPGVQNNLDGPSADADAGVPPLAERLAAHAEDAQCAGCHALMDPIGLGLENFDAVGRYRLEDEGESIDARGEILVDGETRSFTGPVELGELLSEDPRLARCATQKLLTYMLARELTKNDNDNCRLQALLDAFTDSSSNFRDLITNLVQTDAFRARLPPNTGSQKEDK